MKNLYIQMALTYRLSLKSTAKLMKKTEEETFKELTVNTYGYRALMYLWNVEAILEDSETERQKERRAFNFFAMLLSTKKQADRKRQKELLEILLKEERQYQEVKKKCQQRRELEEKDVEIIAKYRTKYAIPANALEGELAISRNILQRLENKIEDQALSQKIQDLNDYYQDYAQSVSKR